MTGRGVAIAIVDSGIDFRNPDFITYDAEGRPTSRLLYLWDTTSDGFDSSGLGSKAPLSYPNGSSIGTLYTREQLTAELRSTVKRIPATDLNGHGTACAGVACADGNFGASGVAPKARLIPIRLASGLGSQAEADAFVLIAERFLSQPQAADKPEIYQVVIHADAAMFDEAEEEFGPDCDDIYENCVAECSSASCESACEAAKSACENQ